MIIVSNWSHPLRPISADSFRYNYYSAFEQPLKNSTFSSEWIPDISNVSGKTFQILTV